jgi:hypothetical protein
VDLIGFEASVFLPCYRMFYTVVPCFSCVLFRVVVVFWCFLVMVLVLAMVAVSYLSGAVVCRGRWWSLGPARFLPKPRRTTDGASKALKIKRSVKMELYGVRPRKVHAATVDHTSVSTFTLTYRNVY